MTIIEAPFHAVPRFDHYDDQTWVKEYEAILDAYELAGGEPASLQSLQIARLIVSANHVLSINEVPGVHIATEALASGIFVRIIVEPQTRLEQPVHLCFAMLAAEGTQRIVIDYDIGADAQVALLAHCIFPNARNLYHMMEGNIRVRSHATLAYTEVHYHGLYGGIRVIPQAHIQVDEWGHYQSTLSVIHGRVGMLKLDYQADIAAHGRADMTTKAYGSADDDICVREGVHLNGPGAQGLAKTRIAVRDRARSRVFTTAVGNAPYACGHMDCAEIVRDEAVAENAPRVVVRDNHARVTHAAAIGTVNKQELEQLMARGLDEETAVDTIIRDMLK